MTTTLAPCSDCGYSAWLKCLGCEGSICDGECSITKGLTIRERRFCSSDCEAKFPDYSSETDSLHDEDGYECECCHTHVGESDYAGCCSDGDCPKKVEGLCTDCGHWDADKEQWLCPDCHASAKADEQEDNPTCDKCEEPLGWDDNMNKGFSVPEPSRYGQVCSLCIKELTPASPKDYQKCLLKGEKFFCKTVLGDPTLLDLFARPDDTTVGDWVGQYSLKEKAWLVRLEGK